jgi:thiol-disulfide isomerase/thioredoxin
MLETNSIKDTDTFKLEEKSESAMLEKTEKDNTIIENSKKTLDDVYQQYSKEKVEMAIAEEKDIVLFFSASWCPTCRGAKNDIAKNFTQLPKDLVIFEVDFDKERELKSKYNIVTQHTFVQIDKNMEQITTWNGGGTKAVIDNIK